MAEYVSELCLPQDVVEEILSRLPPKSLMRFKCVRKSWYNLIHSPSFVAKNLSYSKNNSCMSCMLFKHYVLKDKTIKDKNEITSILREYNNNRKDTWLSLVTLDDHLNNFGCVVQDFPLPSHITISGHCDGIVCLQSRDDVILCNLAIKEGFVYLPNSCLLLPPKYREDFDNEDDYYDALESSLNGVGFGFDSKAKVYKVVRIVGFSSGYVFTPHRSRAEVFTVGSASWREINYHTEACVCDYSSFNICLEGICYFYALTGDTNFESTSEILLAFDTREELFYEISVPESIDYAEHFIKTLSVWKESIALIAYKEDEGPNKLLAIWVMDQSGGHRGSWTKHVTIGPVECVRPLRFWESDNILMHTADGCVVSYNRRTQALSYLPFYVEECVVYVNSIISVKAINSSVRQLA